jgi:hypothetical protein
VLRRAVAVLVVLACAAGVVAYQATRPEKAPASSRVFVPSPKFFLDFSPSFRTSIADLYYLDMVQYYGEHLKSGELDALPAMVDLVTQLSPHFQRPYEFGAFALIDAGRPDLSVKYLERGFKENPGQWGFPSLLAYFAYEYGPGTKEENDLAAARWYEKAAAIPGSPSFLLRLAAVLSGKAGELQKSVTMWGQVYASGDKYSRQKAVDGLEKILPPDKTARMKALAPLYDTMPKVEFQALIAELFKGYK